MRRFRVPVRAAFIVIIAAWIILASAAGIIAVEGALHPARHPVGHAERAYATSVAARDHAVLEDVFITAEDGAILRGWSIKPLVWNGTSVILLHGQSDNRSGMLGKADLLLRHGYSVFLPDARAHGESGGALATYGVKEAYDLRDWFELIRRTESPRCIDGVGESMGAAQILIALRTEPNFCAVVAESPFASFREASYARLGEMMHTGPWAGRTLLRPAVEASFLYARWRYSVDLEQASPEQTVSASRTPGLLIHGEKDSNLPIHQSELIMSHSASRQPAVVLWRVPSAEHCGAQDVMPEEFEERVIGWFNSHDKLA